MSTAWDAIVVGGGPAGMAAAARLAEGGARVALFDEQAELGGQIYRGIERNSGNPALRTLLGKDYVHGEKLVARLRHSGAEIRLGHGVWQLGGADEIWTRSGETVGRHRATHLVLATGALERPVPVPGWTLPGVMSIGALQIMLKSAGLVGDGPIVLAGSGPLFYLVAHQLIAAGVRDIVLLDTAAPAQMLKAAPLLPGALRGQGLRYLMKGLALLASNARAGIKTFHGVTGVSIEGEGRAEAVSFTAGGVQQRLPCALVGLHEGVVPHPHAALSLGCAQHWDARQRAFRPVTDGWGRSSVKEVWIAGDAAGIEGARAAEHGGRIAALGILTDLGRLQSRQRATEFLRERKGRSAHLTARPLLDTLYAPRAELFEPPDATIVCRCENVSAGAVRAAIEAGSTGPNQTKAFLRTGMGPCQGRFCGATVSAMLAGAGFPAVTPGQYRARPPLRPVTLAQLAAAGQIMENGE